MADVEQLEQLTLRTRDWNQWRQAKPLEEIDLRDADLSRTDLSKANLSKANLIGANLSGANLSNANLITAELSGAFLHNTYLFGANLSGAFLNNTDLYNAYLGGANLNSARLYNANLYSADLSLASLDGAVLNNANLSEAKIFTTSFRQATLTGACIADWQMNNSTIFDGVKCDYIFRSYDYDKEAFTGRLPVDPDSTFQPSEFEQWIAVRKGALDTIDITFTKGINWQAFFQSLQTVRQQHPEADIIVKAVEEEGGSFVARLKLETELTGEARDKLKASVESEVKAYALKLAEAQGEIKALQWSLERTLRMGSNNINQNFYGPTGNVAGTNWGNMTATINNNYGAQADDIIQLLTSLRESAQFFPDEHRAMAELQVEDLTNDVAQPQPNPARLKTRLMALLGIAIALGTHIATATDFANNVLELSQKLDVPAQALQPQLEQLKQIYPDFNW
jgi:hypothetical protein